MGPTAACASRGGCASDGRGEKRCAIAQEEAWIFQEDDMWKGFFVPQSWPRRASAFGPPLARATLSRPSRSESSSVSHLAAAMIMSRESLEEQRSAEAADVLALEDYRQQYLSPDRLKP